METVCAQFALHTTKNTHCMCIMIISPLYLPLLQQLQLLIFHRTHSAFGVARLKMFCLLFLVQHHYPNSMVALGQ